MDTASSGDSILACQLRLFVAGSSERSLHAITWVREICHRQLRGKVNLEVIDIYQQPDLAVKYKIVTTPLLIRVFPSSARHVVGDFSDKERMLDELRLEPAQGFGYGDV